MRRHEELFCPVTAISQSTEEGEENSTQKVYRYGEVVELRSGNNNVKYEYDYKRNLNRLILTALRIMFNIVMPKCKIVTALSLRKR